MNAVKLHLKLDFKDNQRSKEAQCDHFEHLVFPQVTADVSKWFWVSKHQQWVGKNYFFFFKKGNVCCYPFLILLLLFYITQEGEPCKEGGWAEAEQRKQQDDQVEGDGAGFAPPVFKRADIRSIISTVTEIKRADGGVPSRLSVWVWTDDWGTNQQQKSSKDTY